MTEKNRKKEEAKKLRVTWGMNLGTRSHKSKKDYNRKANKRAAAFAEEND